MSTASQLECLCRSMHLCMHAQMDGQTENIMPLAHLLDGREV